MEQDHRAVEPAVLQTVQGLLREMENARGAEELRQVLEKAKKLNGYCCRYCIEIEELRDCK